MHCNICNSLNWTISPPDLVPIDRSELESSEPEQSEPDAPPQSLGYYPPATEQLVIRKAALKRGTPKRNSNRTADTQFNIAIDALEQRGMIECNHNRVPLRWTLTGTGYACADKHGLLPDERAPIPPICQPDKKKTKRGKGKAKSKVAPTELSSDLQSIADALALNRNQKPFAGLQNGGRWGVMKVAQRFLDDEHGADMVELVWSYFEEDGFPGWQKCNYSTIYENIDAALTWQAGQNKQAADHGDDLFNAEDMKG